MMETGSVLFERVRGVLRRRPEQPRGLNLALQGGGAHGAFTWGVLDRLLESRAFAFDGVSGTSAGAVNAVALAAGFMEGEADGAREKLEAVWRSIGESGGFLPLRRSREGNGAPVVNSDDTLHYAMLRMLMGLFSPYDLNPLEIDPLRRILDDQIDFKALGRRSPMALFINATEVSTGRGRVFTGREVSLDAVLASACLPAVRHAVKIGRQHYWDGAFSANPALLPLIEATASDDTLIVRLAPDRAPELPRKARDIQGHISRLMFSQPLRKEIEAIETGRRTARRGLGLSDTLGRRLKRHRFHLVDAARYTKELGHASALAPDRDLLEYLQACGRRAMAHWLGRNKEAVGRQSTVDLADKFL